MTKALAVREKDTVTATLSTPKPRASRPAKRVDTSKRVVVTPPRKAVAERPKLSDTTFPSLLKDVQWDPDNAMGLTVVRINGVWRIMHKPTPTSPETDVLTFDPAASIEGVRVARDCMATIMQDAYYSGFFAGREFGFDEGWEAGFDDCAVADVDVVNAYLADPDSQAVEAMVADPATG